MKTKDEIIYQFGRDLDKARDLPTKGYQWEIISLDKDYQECKCPFCNYLNINGDESDLCEHFSGIIDEKDGSLLWEFTNG